MAENPFFYPIRRDTKLPPPPNRFISCRILGKPVPLAYVYQSSNNDRLLFVLQDLIAGSLPPDSRYPLGFKHGWAIYRDSDSDVTDVTVLEPVCGSATAEESIAASKGQPVCSHPNISSPSLNLWPTLTSVTGRGLALSETERLFGTPEWPSHPPGT